METTGIQTSPPRAVIDRLLNATNDHHLDALVGCFAPGYVNETPAHPARGFTGAEQVRRNWTQIFAAVPDLVAKVTGWAEGSSTVWTEWEMSGRRVDGTPHLMRGVIIFTVADDRIASARFYLEPVETSSGDVNAAVRAQMAVRP
jgi:ketosteroid isomerase-like protein